MHCLCCTKLAFLTCWIHYIFVVFNPASITCRIHCIFAVFNPAYMYPLSFTCLILCLRCIQTWLSHVLNTLLLRCVQPGLHMVVVFTYLIHCLFLYQLWLFSRAEYTASSLYSTRLYHELNTLHPRCIQSGFLTCWTHCIFAVFNPALSRIEYTASLLYSIRLSHVLNTLHLRCVQPGLHMGYINTYYIILLFWSIGSPTSPCVNLIPLFCSRGVTYMILPDTSIMFCCVISWYNTEYWAPKQCIQHMGNHIWIPRRRSIRHVNDIGHMLTGLDTAKIQCVRHMIKTSWIQQRWDVSNTWEKQVWYGESNISDTGKITYM